MRLLVDEDTQANFLVRRLREAGHDVQTVREAGLMHKHGFRVLAHARQEGGLTLTKNCDDFRQLHEADANHPGLLLIYQDNNVLTDLSDAAIVQAIANVEASGWELAGQIAVLNQWNFLPAPRQHSQ